MSIAMMKGKAVEPVDVGSERSTGERSEPVRSAEPTSTGTVSQNRTIRDPEVLERPVRRSFTAEYKARIVREVEACTEPGQIGAILRREGLYSSHLQKWRKGYALGGVAALTDNKRGRKPVRNPLDAENEKLRKQNARLEKRLKQAELIIDFQKKVSEILGIPLASIEEINGDD